MTATRQTAYENLASPKKSVVGAHKSSDAYEMRDAWKSFERAIVVARQLVSQNPTTNNLEVLVQMIFEGTQLVPEVHQAVPYWDEGLECIEKLRQLGKTGMVLSRYEHVFEHTRVRVIAAARAWRRCPQIATLRWRFWALSVAKCGHRLDMPAVLDAKSPKSHC